MTRFGAWWRNLLGRPVPLKYAKVTVEILEEDRRQMVEVNKRIDQGRARRG